MADSIPRVNDSGPGQRVSDLKIELLILDDFPRLNKVRITWRSPNYLGKESLFSSCPTCNLKSVSHCCLFYDLSHYCSFDLTDVMKPI